LLINHVPLSLYTTSVDVHIYISFDLSLERDQPMVFVSISNRTQIGNRQNSRFIQSFGYWHYLFSCQFYC